MTAISFSGRKPYCCLAFRGKKAVTLPLNIQGTLIGGLIIVLSILLLFGLAKLNETQNANRLENKMYELQLQRAVLSEIQFPDDTGMSIADRGAYESEKDEIQKAISASPVSKYFGPLNIRFGQPKHPLFFIEELQHSEQYFFLPSIDGSVNTLAVAKGGSFQFRFE